MARSSSPIEAFTIPPSSLTSPSNSTILITGGSSGIGLCTAQLLLSLPNNRIAILDRSPPPPSLLSAHKNRVLYLPCDITSWPSQRDAFTSAAASLGGRIDYVFVNAGINEYQDQFFDERVDEKGRLVEPDRRTLDVDLRSAADTLRLAVHWVRKNEVKNKDGGEGGCRGGIVMIASLAGYLASAGAPLYSAAKFGIVGLMRALKNDLSTLQISISVVGPGITLTDLITGLNPGQTLQEWANDMRRRGVPINTPEEVAAAVVWLMGQGMKANGMGLLIQAGKCADVEAGIARSRGVWMGEEMLSLFRGGRQAPLFPNKL